MHQNKCYNKTVPLILGHIMKFIHNTILTLVLLVPVVIYANAEMQVDIEDEVDVKQTIVEEIIDEEQPDEVSVKELTIKSYIQEKFGSNWKLAYAVMYAESRGKATARNVNTSGSVDNGYWQINSQYHPQITLECSQDIICSTDYAYKLSKGTDFSLWWAYKNSSYKEFLN